MPAACQSREAACPQAGESTFPILWMVLLLGMGLCEVWIRRGGVSENVPGARFPADLARPQAGESAFPHNTLKPKCT